ncbi:MAG: hypothetical protein HY815_18585 [Candidatus Riflebacteria bacterium]|nr:hypothetical protein [Candidatus Riflebacteria bacterium]
MTRGVLRARRELARLGWPVEQQAVDFTIEVTDLGTDRLGVTDRSNRMRITVPDRMAEPGEDLSVALSALLAHEYLHLCQYRCLRGARAIREERFLWWMEATAIYLEYRLAPVDPKTGQKRLTYVDAVSTGRGEHSRSGLESAAGGSSLGYAYAPLAFLMADALGPEALVRTWMQIAADSRVDSAVEAIELCLSEPGEARHTFGELFEAYARHMASGASSAVRTDLGLDVVEALDLAPGPAGASTTRISLPGLSFSVFALRPGRGDPRGPVAEFRGAPGLKAFRLEGCDDRRLEPDRLVVVNVSRTEKAGRILWGPKPAAPGAGPRRTARGGPGRPVPSNGPPGFDAPRPSPGGAAGRP